MMGKFCIKCGKPAEKDHKCNLEDLKEKSFEERWVDGESAPLMTECARCEETITAGEANENQGFCRKCYKGFILLEDEERKKEWQWTSDM